jgi:hypothetical protein
MPIDRARAVVLLALIMITSLPLASQILATPEWKLRVAVDTASIRLKPDLDGPIAATVPRAAILLAYEASGAWYRVLATATPGGAAVIGYIATSDVDVLEEKTAETADFWPIPEPVFRGLGLTFRFTGGLGFFRSADLDASMEGMAALAEEAILSRGLSPVTRDVSPLHSGAFMGGDVLWALSPRLSVGAGFSYTRANSASVYTYNRVQNQDFSLDNSGLLQVYAYRLVASTTIPLNRTAGLVLCVGPALYHANFVHTLAYADNTWAWNDRTAVAQNVIGGHASLALEISLNDRVGLFAQATGRLARFAALAGTETILQEDYSIAKPALTYAGDLFFLADGGFSRTAVSSSPPSGPGAVRKAVLDFSGVDVLFGFRVRF